MYLFFRIDHEGSQKYNEFVVFFRIKESLRRLYFGFWLISRDFASHVEVSIELEVTIVNTGFFI